MAYLMVLIALVFMAVKGFCGKKIGVYTRHTGDAYLFNFLRVSLCLAIGLCLVFFSGDQAALAVDGGLLAISAFAGAANAAFMVCWLLAVQSNSMVTVDVSLTVGSLLPAVLYIFCFGEPFSWQKLVGFAVILLATVILAGYNKSLKGKPTVAGILLVVAAAVSDGCISFSQQLYKHYYTAGGSKAGERLYPNSVFQVYTYVFAALLLGAFFLGYLLLQKKEGHGAVDEPPRRTRSVGDFFKGPLPLIAVMAVSLFAANFFQTSATSDYGMSPQVLYPMIKGAGLVIVNINAALFFHERVTPRSLLGSALALVGVVVVNVF